MSQSPPISVPPARSLSAAASAPPSASGFSVSSGGEAPEYGSTNAIEVFFGLVRDIRAEAQNLQSSLQEVQLKTQLSESASREREVKAALQANDKIFGHNRQQIDDRLEDLRAFMRANPFAYSNNGDDVTFIENYWERATNSWPNIDDPLDEIIVKMVKADHYLSKMICRCGLVTIPARVNEHLRQLRVGRPLDFHATFEDELPILADRLAVLNYLYAHPLAIEGVVDVEQGSIFRVSPNLGRRVVSFVIPILLPLLGAWLLPIAYRYYQPAASEEFLRALLKSYWALIAGGYIHVVVGALKEARANKGKSFLAIEDWILWLHVKELQIIVGILSLWVGFIGVLAINKSISVGTAFFVGYSIDSFADLFLERFSNTVTARTQSLKTDLTKG
jgi:hypothetical protein